MAKSDPLGCPFCVSYEVEIARTNPNACWVQCAHCGGRTASHRTRIGAIANWNLRSHSTPAATASIVRDDDRDWTPAQKRATA